MVSFYFNYPNELLLITLFINLLRRSGLVSAQFQIAVRAHKHMHRASFLHISHRGLKS